MCRVLDGDGNQQLDLLLAQATSGHHELSGLALCHSYFHHDCRGLDGSRGFSVYPVRANNDLHRGLGFLLLGHICSSGPLHKKGIPQSTHWLAFVLCGAVPPRLFGGPVKTALSGLSSTRTGV